MDIALVLTPVGFFDAAIANGDLLADGGLDTAVIISLFSDREADEDDEIPDGSGDRRGWWGDAFLDPLADGTPDHLGSRLWLLSRALQTQETALAAQAYCQEALQWLVDDGAAGAITVPVPTFPSRGFMEIVVVVAQQSAQGAPVDRRYTALWDITRATLSSWAIIAGGI